jgi:hypothetical protein
MTTNYAVIIEDKEQNLSFLFSETEEELQNKVSEKIQKEYLQIKNITYVTVDDSFFKRRNLVR